MTRSYLCLPALLALLCGTPGQTAFCAEGTASGAETVADAEPVATAGTWADSVLASLSLEQKLGQMIMVGVDGHFLAANSEPMARVESNVRDLGVGGLILWQSDVYEAAHVLATLQELAPVPLLVAADFERGPAMRVRRSTAFPDAMAIAATRDPHLAYLAGLCTAREARAIGVHQNYAPVADVNTNPANPVINTRAFSDDTGLVRQMVEAYVRGSNAGGVIATVKHFPGHGDTGLDSHLALPVLDATRERLEEVELSPFRAGIDAGAGAVMVAHLAVPVLDSTGVPASVSAPIVSTLLLGELGFGGLVVTDAMEMRGVTREFSASEAALRAVLAGVDIVLMPPSEHLAVEALYRAMGSGVISQERLDRSVRKILLAKEALGLNRTRTVRAEEIPQKVATAEHRLLAKEIARRSLTVLTNVGDVLPLRLSAYRRPLLLVLNDKDDNWVDIHRPGPRFTTEPAGAYFRRLLSWRNGEIRTLRLGPGCGDDQMETALEAASGADLVLVELHVRVRTSSGSIGMPERFTRLIEGLEDVEAPVVAISFGTPYVLEHFSGAQALVCAYGDAEPLVEATVEGLCGEIPVGGRLPVAVGTRYPFGSGLEIPQSALRCEVPGLTGFEAQPMLAIDRAVRAAIRDSAFPGAQLAVSVDGRLVYAKAFGTMTYDAASSEITMHSLFDLASLTKVFATTAATMMLVEKGEIGLDDPVGKYLPAFAEGEKAAITIRHLLTHTSGFPPFRRFFLFCRNASEALDSIFATPLVATPGDTTIYSDLGMITMGKVIEQVSGLGLDAYVRREFYEPLGMASTMFTPPAALADDIVPTEYDSLWRHALVHGTVHDENAALLGGVSGHAGLFSTASDLAVFVQMLLNDGVYAGRRYLSARTIRQFVGTRPENRRFLGWDFRSVEGSSSGSMFSPSAFGHTGFTGTSVWVDPERRIAVVLLTNRVYPTRANHRIFEVRPALHDTIMRSLVPVHLPQ
jgi:beta-N-acetylhexosaminidase